MALGSRIRDCFHQQTVEDYVVAGGAAFDLAVICDVMHHIPWEMHDEILKSAKIRQVGRFSKTDSACSRTGVDRASIPRSSLAK